MPLIVAAVGRSGSGKTVTIEYLIRQLSIEGYKVGAIKHIHHKGFTIDTEGKNTWKYAQAGAKVIVAISPNEVAIIKKTSQKTDNLEQIIDTLKEETLDLLFIEGYHDLISQRVDILKILTAKDAIDLHEVLEGTVEPILAVSGLITKNSEKDLKKQKYPFIKIPEEGKQLVELIKQQVIKSKKEEAF
jgi:molybdopterin-guanine dinucleotide biosynthesis protein B